MLLSPAPRHRALAVLRSLALVTILVPLSAVEGRSDDSKPIDFATRVRPILSKHCFACHGPDDASRAADLRLDTADGATEDRGGYRAIVAGDPDRSDAFRRIVSDDPDLVMPPADHGEPLEAEEIELVRRWIAEGAEYATHWAFVPPTRPAVPTIANAGDRVRSPIDAFVLEAIEREGLVAAGEADRETLIRRVSLDLIGLPPTVAEIDAFLADDQPGAYERLVERLLESRRFGEHWARLWLDLARYADTKGYEKDQPREMWRYRDWVIDALNDDLPYERFTLEQLAGDLIESADERTILATAFHRNTMTNDEGGTDDEEFRIAAVKDRVDTTVQVWMGLTMGCAKCHSHKYDPITHADYYSFLAFFDQTEDADRFDDEPKLPTPTPAQRQELEELGRQIDALRQRYDAVTDESEGAFAAWRAELAEAPIWVVPEIATAETLSESRLEVRPDRSLLATGPAAETETYRIRLTVEPGEYRSLRIDALTDPSLGRGGPGRNPDDPNFVLSELKVRSIVDGQATDLSLVEPVADFEQQGWPVVNAIDGNGTTGWAISPQQGKPHAAVFRFAEPLTVDAPIELEIELSQQYGNRLVFGALRLGLGIGDAAKQTADVPSLDVLASIPSEHLSEDDRRRLDQAFRRVWPSTAPLFAELSALEERRQVLDRAIPRTPILRELPAEKRRTTRVHLRGNFLEPGEVVTPGVPTAFGSLPDGVPLDRRAVTAWLFAPENPLTYRVAANRVWSQFFGRGIVETEEDFGSQGSLPTHPELLDWLAVSYRDDLRGSLKGLCRLIVTSATYRRSAVGDSESMRRDPANRWLARAPRPRLSGEAVRDASLVAAGLLSDRIGGPSVMPMQPDGIWQTTYSSLEWQTSPGEDRHRRSIYTFLRRTSPYPSLVTFDAGSREVCLIRRISTNTPLQALVTLNDPVFVEAAGALGRRMRAAGSEFDVRITEGFRRVVGRHPSDDEIGSLARLVDEIERDFKDHPEAAAEMAAAGGAADGAGVDRVADATWTVVGNVLLNLAEAVVRP